MKLRGLRIEGAITTDPIVDSHILVMDSPPLFKEAAATLTVQRKYSPFACAYRKNFTA